MDRVAIVCGAPSSEMSAPWDDATIDIWVLGNRSQRYPRFDRIFEIHDDLSQHDPQYAQWLVDKDVDLIVGENFPIDSDHVTVFPYKECSQLIGSTYLTSSSACMLAYALLQGYKYIELYGVDMAVDDHEYFWQRPCMEFWVGFAKGMGCDVVIPEQSPLCKSEYVEGRDFGTHRPQVPFAANEYTELAESHAQKVELAHKRYAELQSAIDEAEQIKLQITAHDAAKQVYERMAKVQRAIDNKQPIQSLSHTVEMK